jgi:TRAP-type mannitol/chloroaromatic compound transport system permease small subunit
MPELSFVLPHWMYWAGLLLFPLAAFWMRRRFTGRPSQTVSPALAYFLLITGGFVGVHRLYLKSRWALAFVVLFVAVLVVNIEMRLARDHMSEATAAVHMIESRIARAERNLQKAEQRLERRDSERNRQRVEEERADLAKAVSGQQGASQELELAHKELDLWQNISRGLALALLFGILMDALLLPRLVRARNAIEKPPAEPGFSCPAVEQVEAEHDDSREPYAFNRVISKLNARAGEFVAYWSIIAVFVYYYEVVARYVFNSPTNWAHESMFLMFGMQYLIAGGFCLRENAHVRVDVIYAQLSKRTRAVMDVITSVFFFIFVLTLLVTGWTFFYDSYEIGEVSFTEWGIQYWPVKFALSAGAILLLLQGIAQLAKDIAVLRDPEHIALDTETRPEG